MGGSSWVDGGLGVWGCPCMMACTCTQMHTHKLNMVNMIPMKLAFFAISIHVSFNIYVHAVHVGVPQPPDLGGPNH